MAEPVKRGLRERPRKRNFDSDNDDGQPYPYIKTYPKEFVNPSQQLNQDAKLLIKFINTINRAFAEAQHLKLQKQNQVTKSAQGNQSKPTKKEESGKDHSKKMNESGKGTETQQVRKGKQVNSNNGQNKSYQKGNNNKGEDFLTKIKGMALASASSMLELQKTLGKNQGNGELSKKCHQFNPAQKNKTDSSSYYVIKGKQKNGPGQKEEHSSNKFQIAEHKIFKRSAYHVAIAYHIFLSQKGRNVMDNSAYDPTFPAKRLKEQMSKRAF